MSLFIFPFAPFSFSLFPNPTQDKLKVNSAKFFSLSFSLSLSSRVSLFSLEEKEEPPQPSCSCFFEVL
ncbi:hypothetical protein VNO78_26074 [Psophocarpus tetragonolobus]|uniref:Uncharacterized protein n=1 Tax=Psophocarpus tetragonolobus TaxID=3891 RepID=A0AAN9RZY7_PSOTE